VNLAIAERVARQLRDAGVTVDLLPATVPARYDADALVAIHADDGGGSNERGWKIAASWRSSPASRSLRDTLAQAYGLAVDMPEDRYGVSFNMRGYYAFSWTRYDHAAAPSTPAAIIETGFLTSAADRQVIVDDPERVARGISMGIMAFLGRLSHMSLAARVPAAYPPMTVASELAPLRYFPGDTERVAARIPAGTRVRAMDVENGWVELVVAGHFREFGWMKATDLEPPVGG
jgi:N-acetylmuramoyl-L-alanine amidase